MKKRLLRYFNNFAINKKCKQKIWNEFISVLLIYIESMRP